MIGALPSALCRPIREKYLERSEEHTGKIREILIDPHSCGFFYFQEVRWFMIFA